MIVRIRQVDRQLTRRPTCLYFRVPAAEHQRPSAGADCAHPRTDSQVELTWAASWLHSALLVEPGRDYRSQY